MVIIISCKTRENFIPQNFSPIYDTYIMVVAILQKCTDFKNKTTESDVEALL